MKVIIRTDNAPEPIGPYNQAILVNNTLYVSGQVGLNPDFNTLVTETIEKETHQVMANIQAILDEAGFTFNDVVKCTIFVRDLNNFTKINEAYGSYFDEEIAPARETVEVSKLPRNVNVEISCIAVR